MDKKASMEKLVREAYEKGGFTGVWFYAEKGEIISKGAIGMNGPDEKEPIREDMVFDLASVTKQFTATAIMLLRRRGLLSLDDEITKFFPELPYKGITVRNLLNHTGGLPDYMKWVAGTAEKEHTIPGNDIMIRFLCECGEEAAFAPGEEFDYSNTGYCVLAEIVEKVSGVRFEDFLEQNIFIPAGMTVTKVYHRRKDHFEIPNLAIGMVPKDGRYIIPDDAEDDDHCVVPLDGANGDGLVHSNIFDLFKWDRALREETVLTLEEQKLMYTAGRLNSGEVSGEGDGEDGYGFGWGIINDKEFGLIVEHSGSWPGYYTQYERFIDADRVLIHIRCRRQEDGRALKGLWEGMEAIARDKEPEPVICIEDVALNDPDKSNWESFTGKYEHPEDVDFIVDEVWMQDGELYARAFDDDGDELKFKLYPIGEKKFGRKGGLIELTFGEGCLTYIEKNCKKL